ncbi:MAG: NlpC/P60 family protein [Christensenella sp.]
MFYTNNGGNRVGHTGIVIGDGLMIDASSSNGKVVRRAYDDAYWRNHFVCGRRPW